MSTSKCSWDTKTMRTGFGWGGSYFVPGKSHEVLYSLMVSWAPSILILCLMNIANFSWDAETKRTGLGWGGSDFVPGEPNEELYSLMVSWCSLLAQIHGLLVSVPYEPMVNSHERFMGVSWSVAILSPPLPLMVLLSCEHPIFSSDISWAHQNADETQRPWE